MNVGSFTECYNSQDIVIVTYLSSITTIEVHGCLTTLEGHIHTYVNGPYAHYIWLESGNLIELGLKDLFMVPVTKRLENLIAVPET